MTQRHVPLDSWHRPAGLPRLGQDEVHIWKAGLMPSRERLEALARTLSREELARAGRFHFTEDRERFILSHGILRELLSRYLNTRPECVALTTGPFGKPQLAESCGGKELRFNMSHSGAMALYAFSLDRELGVDLEQFRSIPDRDRIIARFFSGSERKFLSTLPAHEREEAFFRFWTAKEAYIKGTGKGLSQPLDGFSVVMTECGEVRLEDRWVDEKGKNAYWDILNLSPETGYKAALAVKSDGRSLHYRQFTYPTQAFEHTTRR